MNDDVSLSGETAPDDDPFADVPSGEPTSDEPQEPPFQDVSSGPDEERLGGVDVEGEDEQQPEEPQEPVVPDAEGEDQDGFPVGGVESEEPHDDGSEPAPEEPGADPDPEPEAEAEPEAPESKGKRASPKQKGVTPKREYLLFEEVSKDTFKVVTTVSAYNGEAAIREVFREQYADDLEQPRNLVPLPTGNWRPREVKGRSRANVAIEIV